MTNKISQRKKQCIEKANTLILENGTEKKKKNKKHELQETRNNDGKEIVALKINKQIAIRDGVNNIRKIEKLCKKLYSF